MGATPAEAAQEVLVLAPLVMRTIRSHMRQQRTGGLSVPQFRALTFLDSRVGVFMSDLAEHIGVTLASMTRLVDTLEAQDWVTRERDTRDRRRVRLALTERGRTLVLQARMSTLAQLTGRFDALSATQCQTVVEAMHILHPLFCPGDPTDSDCER
jgi:DNA-binding MarR family transcriptional regulator